MKFNGIDLGPDVRLVDKGKKYQNVMSLRMAELRQSGLTPDPIIVKKYALDGEEDEEGVTRKGRGAALSTSHLTRPFQTLKKKGGDNI